MYALVGFNVFEAMGYVVEVDPKEIDEFTHRYPTFTSNFTIPYTTLIHTTTTDISKKVISDLPKTEEIKTSKIKNSEQSKKNTQINSQDSLPVQGNKEGKEVKNAPADIEKQKVKSREKEGKFTLKNIDFKTRVKDWCMMSGKKVSNETKTEISMWVAQSITSLKVNPSDVRTFLEKEYNLNIGVEKNGSKRT